MFKSINSKGVRAGFLMSMLVLLLAPTTFAADFRYDQNHNPSFEVSQNDSVKNLYTAGSQVVVKANPSKDLVIAGGTLDIDGNVGYDLIAAGGTVNVRGNVGGSARIAGGNIHIDSKTIGEDLVVAGGTVYISTDTVINGDLLVAGGNVYVDGKINGNILSRNSGSLVLGSNAEVKGSINYSSPYVYQRDPNAKVGGEVKYTHVESHRGAKYAFLTAAFVVKMLGELVMVLLLLFVLKNIFRNSIQKVGFGFWKNVGFGIIALISIPIAIGILAVSVIGWYAAIMLFLIYILMLMYAWLIAAAYFGSWVISKIKKEEIRVNYLTVALGIILAGILKMFPVLGALFAAALLLAGMGTFIRHYRKTE
jgi:cytoskeletal protein CcmA (bactofilin family)